MTNEELHWLAGLVEGEGCFTLDKGRVRFQVKMTDLDIIEKVQQILVVGSIYKLTKSSNRKQAWIYDLTNQTAVTMVMLKLYPLMGVRRRTKIRELLSEHTFV